MRAYPISTITVSQSLYKYIIVTNSCHRSRNSSAEKHRKTSFWIVPSLNKVMSMMFTTTIDLWIILHYNCDRHHTNETNIFRCQKSCYTLFTWTHIHTSLTTRFSSCHTLSSNILFNFYASVYEHSSPNRRVFYCNCSPPIPDTFLDSLIISIWITRSNSYRSYGIYVIIFCVLAVLDILLLTQGSYVSPLFCRSSEYEGLVSAIK